MSSFDRPYPSQRMRHLSSPRFMNEDFESSEDSEPSDDDHPDRVPSVWDAVLEKVTIGVRRRKATRVPFPRSRPTSTLARE